MALSLDFRRTATMSFFAQGVQTPTLKTCVEDELDGYIEEEEAPLKRLRPGTNGLKGLQLDGRFVSATDGSLPTTPDPEELDYAELERDTRQLLLDFYRTHTGMCPVDRKLHHAIPTMKRVVDNILVKHQIAYKGMIQRLQLDSQPASLDFIRCIASTMFKDGVTNWGRIASLVAFGAVVCSRLKELQQDQCVERVAEQISSYLTSEQQDWILKNKSWHGFVEFFHQEDVESVVRHGLLALVGCAGIGAGLAFLIR